MVDTDKSSLEDCLYNMLEAAESCLSSHLDSEGVAVWEIVLVANRANLALQKLAEETHVSDSEQ